MTKKSWKGKSKSTKRKSQKFNVKRTMNDFERDEDILRLAIKEVEYSKPMLQKNLSDLGAIKKELDNIRLSSHQECLAPMIEKVHASIEEIHEDVRSSTKNLQFKVEKMCILKNKLAFLNKNMKDSSKEFWDEVNANKKRCERQFTPQRNDRVVKEPNHEFVYSISEDGTRNEETECDYHTYVDNMCQEWDKVDPLGVFGKEYNNDQQKVVNKRKWHPKPKDQRQFRNWNRKHNIRSSNRRRNLFKMKNRYNLPDEEVLVTPVDALR
jgi:hypothetical protein